MNLKGEVQQVDRRDDLAKVHSGRLLATTSTGPIRKVRVAGRALPIASALAVLTELADRAEGADRPYQSTIAQRVKREDAYEAWQNFYTPLSLGLLTLPARGRLYVLFEILRHIKRYKTASGVEPLLASAINTTWPLLPVESLETVVAIAKRHIDSSSFTKRHPSSVSDATYNTTTFLAPGDLQRIDVSLWLDEWRLMPAKNAWGMTDAAANDLLGQLGFGGGAAGKFGSWGGGGLPGSQSGDFGFGTPGGFGDVLGRLGFGGGAASKFGSWGGGGLPGSQSGDFGFGTPGGFGDILGRLGFGGGAAGKFGSWGGSGLPGSQNDDFGFGIPGGFEGPLGRLGVGRGPFGAFDPGANGGYTGFGAALGYGGAAHPEGDGFGHSMVNFVESTWKAVGAGSLTINSANKLAAGIGALEVASGVAAVVVVGMAGAYVVGTALAAAEDKSAEATRKAWGRDKPVNPPPEDDSPPPDGDQPGGQQGGHQGGQPQGGGGKPPDPKHHNEGDSYPDPDGSGGGHVDPTWIPADDGPSSGGGNPLWYPAEDGVEPPNPNMIWDENGGGGTPNTIGRGVEFGLIAGQGLLASVIQIGPNTFQMT